MARYRIVHWREIPTVVEAEDASGAVRRPLSPRFQELIDTVAMRLGRSDTEAYLDGWGRGPELERPGAAAAVAEAVAGELEATFEALTALHLGDPARAQGAE
jgi:Virulence factor